jgi:hypothetical protein
VEKTADLIGAKGEGEDVPQHATADAYVSPVSPIGKTID